MYGGSSINIVIRKTAKIPTGRLIKKVQRQEKSSVSQPPSVGPIIGATTIPKPYKALAVPRWLGGKLSSKIDWAKGCMAPPPKPCSTRAKIRMGMLAATPQTKEASVKIMVQPIKNLLRPK